MIFAAGSKLKPYELLRSIHTGHLLNTSRLKNRVPLYKGQTASRRSVEE